MQARLDYAKTAPDGFKAMLGLEHYARHSGLELALLELVKIRASQINGCAFCLDMHSKDARAEGETEQRLYALSAWRETPFFSERERAALAWTEAVTRISETHVPDDESARQQFSEKELVDLTAGRRPALQTREDARRRARGRAGLTIRPFREKHPVRRGVERRGGASLSGAFSPTRPRAEATKIRTIASIQVFSPTRKKTRGRSRNYRAR